MLDPKEEAKFKEFKDRARELRVPLPPEIFIGLKVHDKNGVLVFDDVQRGHSWVRNFYNYMFCCATHAKGDGGSTFGAGYMSAKNTSGAVGATDYFSAVNIQLTGAGYGYVGAATDTTIGIVIGTSDTAFSAEHHALGALIAHGGSTGQMAYQLAVAGAAAYTAGTKTWKQTITRVMNNNSGGSITVKETGLVKGTNEPLFNSYVNLFERSVLSPAVAVANGAQLTVTYEISMDFSAID